MNTTVNVGFPGLGIEQISLDKVAFTLFGKMEVRWYGIVITLGIVLAFLYTIYRGKKNENIKSDDIIDIGILTVVMGVIGARLYYVLNDQHGVYESFMDVIAVWNGGLGIYGGIIGGAAGIFIMCQVKRIKWQTLFDMAAPGVMIAQAVGRWGNFFNGEAYGYMIGNTTRFYFFNKEHVLPSGEGTFFHALRMRLTPNIYSWEHAYDFHPTFLYECAWNVLGFILINLFYKKKRFDGQIALMYIAWYGFGRMFIEGFRTDSLYLGDTNIRISQLLGLAFFLGALALLIVGLIVGKRDNGFLTVEKKAPVLPTPEELAEQEARMEEQERKAEENAMADAQNFLDRMTDFRAETLKKLSRKKSEAKTEETATEAAPVAEEAAVEAPKEAEAHEADTTAPSAEESKESTPEAASDETAAKEGTNPKQTEE